MTHNLLTMSKMYQKTRNAVSVTISSLCLAGVALAEEGGSSPDAFKNLFDAAVLYKDSNNPYLQKLAFTGRAQLDYVVIEGDGSPVAGGGQDLSYDEFNVRRLRAGFKATFFKDFTAHIEGDFDPDEDVFYQRLTDAYIGWAPCDEFGSRSANKAWRSLSTVPPHRRSCLRSTAAI